MVHFTFSLDPVHCSTKLQYKTPHSDASGRWTTTVGFQTWFDAHAITVLDWPANSLDLNLIENLWGIIKRKMRGTRPKNKEELTASIKEIWASITPRQCHRLIASMPRCIEAVIKAKGFPTKH